MSLFSFESKKQPVEKQKNKDRYRILGPLGKGKYSDVFNCFDEELNRVVALKQLREEYVSNQPLVQSFLNEAKLLSFIEHPGVMILYDIFLNEVGAPAYTMKLVKGNNLRGEYGIRTRAGFLNVFIKLCETMASVHDHGVIHLDLNPENIMVGSYGEVVIIDWGDARLFDDKAYKEYLQFIYKSPQFPTCDNCTLFNSVSPYVSPEQLSGDLESISPSSDIFSMGVILYEMMSGKLPFSIYDYSNVKGPINNFDAVSLYQQSSDIPRFLSQICAKMMAPDPFNRYHSFHSVLTDFDKLQNSGQTFHKRVLQAGEILFKEGESGDFAFIILSGTLEVSRVSDGDKIVLAYLQREEIGGELALFTNEPRSATITATEETTINLLSRESVQNELIKLSPWVQNMIYGLSKRFLRLNDYLVR